MKSVFEHPVTENRMDKRNGMVSIVIPVYNVEKFIIETVESVRSQTYTDWELILVLDGCTDHTPEILKKYCDNVSDKRIRIVEQPRNMGAAAARNKGVQEAGGRYIAYLDSDDLWVKDKLYRQLSFMEEKEAAFSFTGYEFADEKAKGLGKIVRVPAQMKYRDALKNTTIFTSTVMFDTKKLPKEMIFMPQIKSEDTALWWKILRQGYTAYGLDENLVLYRRSGQTLSSNKVEAIRRIWNLYRRAEGLSVCRSAYYFCFWAVRAVLRRV